jgi:hypothetical protein
MTAHVAEKGRQVGLSLSDRIARAVQLLEGEIHGMGKHLLSSYATARITGGDAREALLQAHWGKNVREPAAGWNLPVLERCGDAWVARLDAAAARIRAKAVRS